MTMLISGNKVMEKNHGKEILETQKKLIPSTISVKWEYAVTIIPYYENIQKLIIKTSDNTSSI